MNSYYLQRTARAVLTIWMVATITFGMIRLLPGGPMQQIRAQLLRQPGVSAAEVDARINSYMQLAPTDPIHVQYVDYMSGLVTGNLGTSIIERTPVTEIIAETLPWTLFVMETAQIMIFVIGIVLGAFLAYKEGTKLDSVGSALSIVFSSIPFYVVAILAVYLLGNIAGWFPARYGYDSTVADPGLTIDFIVSVIRHAILPIGSVVITGVGVQLLAMRGNSIQVLGEDFVRVARLRGLSDRRIATRYVARNAILPMYTGFLTLIAFSLGGSVILEQIFSYPGVGKEMLDALQNRDYPLMMGIFLVITIAVVISVYIADLTYGIIDPRVSSGDSSEAY
jgi:peptide/nickel transport system permease protein